MTSASDRELVDRLRRREPGGFDAAYERHAARLFRFLLRFCGSRHAAEDVLQEAWLKLATRAGELDPDTDLSAWLFTVARNAWVSRARTENRLVELAPAHEVADPAEGPEAHAASTAAARAVEQALAALTQGDREVLLLVGVEGMSHEATAGVLGISDVALRQRLHRARSRLTALLEQPGPRRASGDWTEE